MIPKEKPRNKSAAARIAFRRFAPAILACFLASCSFHARNWNSQDSPGQHRAEFRSFQGKEVQRVKVARGDVLFVSCDVNVTNGGLLVSIQDRSHTLWQKCFSQTNDWSDLQLPVERTGEVQIIVEGKQAQGSFNLRYRSVMPKPIEVRTSPNIELFGLLMQLDIAPDALNNNDLVELGNRKAKWRDWYALAVGNYERYREFENGEMMKLYHDYTGKGFFNDFFIGFLLQADEVPHARLKPTTDPEMISAFSKTGDMEEARRKAEEFLQALNRFYGEIAFDRYLEDHRKHYEIIRTEVARNLPSSRFIAAMEAFYGKEFNHYCLLPSLNIPTSMGFGKIHKTAKTVYNAFGPFGFQSFDEQHLDLAFDDADKIRALSVHEFGHSFVNPAVDKVPSGLIKETEELYTPIKAQMTGQGYPSWTICLYEHFVRAGEIIIARKLGHPDEAQRILRDNLKGGYMYLPVIVGELERFDRDADAKRNYDELLPSVIAKLKTP